MDRVSTFVHILVYMVEPIFIYHEYGTIQKKLEIEKYLLTSGTTLPPNSINTT